MKSASNLWRKFPNSIFLAKEYKKLRFELACIAGKAINSESIVNKSNIQEITKEIIVTFGKSKLFFSKGLKKKKKTIILKENKLVRPFTKTLLYPSPSIGVKLSIEIVSNTAPKLKRILITVRGKTIEIVFAIERSPIIFDISSAKIKNNTKKITGERWKYITLSRLVKSITVEKSVRNNKQIKNILIIILKIFPPENSAKSIMSELGKALNNLFMISTSAKPIIPIYIKFSTEPVPVFSKIKYGRFKIILLTITIDIAKIASTFPIL